jgi:glycosyltransferase involved in cell wall biosynthesis
MATSTKIKKNIKNNKKLRLALVVNRFYPEIGGAETNLYFQAQKLGELYDLTIFTPKRENIPSKEIIENFKVRRLFDILNPVRKFPNIKSKTLMSGIFLKILFGKYDIVQVFPSLSYNNILAFAAAKLSSKAFVFCSFDFLDYATIIKSNTGKIDCEMIKKYTPTLRERFILKRCSHIFGISNREIDFFKRYNRNVSYSPVPVFTDEYEQEVDSPREKYNLTNNDFVFLCLGRISSIKGQDIALEAFIKIKDTIPEAKLVFVGRDDYEMDMAEKMKQRIEKFNIADKVIFTGMVERKDVIGWLRYCDIHIIPVRFMNSGAVVVETWAAGSPVIQSDAVDPNYVNEEINGYLFQRENIEELSNKMNKAYKNKNKLPGMAKNGREFVMQNITYGNLINIYNDVYKRILENKRR